MFAIRKLCASLCHQTQHTQTPRKMQDGIAIKKDITAEAKQILKTAMQANCVEYYKRKYIAERVIYWTDFGYSEEIATQKANEDYDWAH